ncbi:DUF5076 domain-containing protein [Lysobacter sp.]|uniref:DUF5076 domain-containing protein n=1 Tax=Lysobacter sp. TaxID=72226 RepID=UPI002D2ED98E|nr:DUF5076 domain-containing protein [Lysobacter sp.]HZX76782.1 DUF5076 domain-containing protein [Lysobacter sp.]
MTPIEELEIPQAAHADPAAFEILRLWAVDRSLHMSLRPELRGDPAEFGALLADLFSYACDAYAATAPRAQVKADMLLALNRRLGQSIESGIAA